MWPVLFANAAWVCILALWCIAYFVQAKADRARRLSQPAPKR